MQENLNEFWAKLKNTRQPCLHALGLRRTAAAACGAGGPKLPGLATPVVHILGCETEYKRAHRD